MPDMPSQDDVLLPRTQVGLEPQYLLLTLLGDYWAGQSRHIPSAVLVLLLAEFGISEGNARQAMRRLTGRGLLVYSKVGRSTAYGMPDRITVAASKRLTRAMSFGTETAEWDERWTVVSFSVPEKERDVRRQLRNGLRRLHFGLLNDAIWISPHNRSQEAGELLDSLGIAHGTVMRAELIPRATKPLSITSVFELESLGHDYVDFIDRHSPDVTLARSGSMPPSKALVLRTMLMSEWLSFRVRDPELPTSLLPSGWPRRTARQVFLEIYDSLGPTAEFRFRQIVSQVDTNLGYLAAHHASDAADVGKVNPSLNVLLA